MMMVNLYVLMMLLKLLDIYMNPLMSYHQNYFFYYLIDFVHFQLMNHLLYLLIENIYNKYLFFYVNNNTKNMPEHYSARFKTRKETSLRALTDILVPRLPPLPTPLSPPQSLEIRQAGILSNDHKPPGARA